MKKANLACAPLPVARILGKFGAINLTRLQAKFDKNLKANFAARTALLNLIQICQIYSNLKKRRINLVKEQICNRQNQAKTRLALFPPPHVPSRQILNSKIQKKEKINEPKFTKRPSLPARISRASDVLAAT